MWRGGRMRTTQRIEAARWPGDAADHPAVHIWDALAAWGCVDPHRVKHGEQSQAALVARNVHDSYVSTAFASSGCHHIGYARKELVRARPAHAQLRAGVHRRSARGRDGDVPP